MTTVRVDSSFLVLLLLMSGVFISVSSVVTPTAHAVFTMSATMGSPPTATLVGTLVTITAGQDVAGSGADTSCSIGVGTSTGVFLNVVTIACTLSGAKISDARFTVGAGSLSGTYTITVTSPSGGSASTAANYFTVEPRVVLFPKTGPSGTAVTVTGSGFTREPSGTGCELVSTIVPAGTPCGQGYGGELSAVFTVLSGWPPGDYLVTAKDANAPTTVAASDTFKITAGPTLILTARSPGVGATGPTGTIVDVTGSGWSTANAYVTLVTVPPTVPGGSSPLWTGPYSFTCPVSGGSIVSCTFTVKSTAQGGPKTVKGTGSASADTTTSDFVVVSSFSISPISGGPGTSVFITGSGYLTGGTCTTKVTAFPSTPSLFNTGTGNPTSCNIDSTSYLLTGQFTVNAIPPQFYGPYTVTINDPTLVQQGLLSVTFTVSVATVTLTANVGPTGTLVTVTGSGWSPSDTFVTLSAVPPTMTDGTSTLWTGPYSFTCSVSSGTIGSCSFTVKSNALGGVHTISATGTPFGDATTVQFIVQSTFVLTPNNGARGSSGSISGSGYLAPNTNCVPLISDIPSPPVFGPITCAIDSNGVLTGTFIVGTTVPSGGPPFGLHMVTISGATWVQQGSISVPFIVNNQMLTFSPSVAPTGTFVTVIGSGWSSLDTSVTLTDTITLPDSSARLWDPPSSRTCTVAGGSIASGCTFTVKSTALGGIHTISAIGMPYGETTTADFVVQSSFILTPNNGGRGISGTISGTGYMKSVSSATCPSHITDSPLPTIFDTGTSPVACTINQYGVLTGTFTIDATTILTSWSGYGAHTVTMADTGADPDVVQQGSISVTFTVNSPTVTLSPNVGPAGTSVTVTGSSYSLLDKGCKIFWVSTSTVIPISGMMCSIASGSVTGSFVVPLGSPPVPSGYLVRVEGYTPITTPDGTSPVDAATATFTMKPTVALTPTSGHAGTNVLVTGSNFVTTPTPGDTGPCTISSTPSGLIQSPVCTVAGGSMSGSFVVAPGASGTYTVTVTGSTGDSGSATFSGPLPQTLVLDPISGPAGTAVSASGENYLGTTCLLTAVPSSLFSSSSCSISAGTLSGGFSVASGAAPGSVYTLSVTTNAGDVATASFAVTAGPPGTLTLTPILGAVGTVVSGLATGFTTDVSCLVTAAPAAILSSPSCTISGGGNANIGFIVAPAAPVGSYTILVVGNTGKAASASFTVTTVTTTTTSTTTTAAPSFDLTVNPSTVTFLGPGTGATTVTVTSINGFHDQVNLAVASFPAGVSGTFAPNPVTPPAGGSTVSVLSLAVAQNAASTITIITIIGTGPPGGPTDTVGLTLIIQGTATTATTTGVTSVTTRTTTGPWVPPKCIIATVTFGSEASPAVQFLRGFRDNLVLSTKAGSAFMGVFDAWYYSFSPSVAQFITNNDPLRAPVRVMLYPLLGILGISTSTYSLLSGAQEFAVVMAGLVASSLIGLVYLTPFTLVGMRALTKRRRINVTNLAKGSLLLLAAALALLAAGELAGSFLLLAVASSAIVLVCLITVPAIVALAVLRPNPK